MLIIRPKMERTEERITGRRSVERGFSVCLKGDV